MVVYREGYVPDTVLGGLNVKLRDVRTNVYREGYVSDTVLGGTPKVRRGSPLILNQILILNQKHLSFVYLWEWVQFC